LSVCCKGWQQIPENNHNYIGRCWQQHLIIDSHAPSKTAVKIKENPFTSCIYVCVKMSFSKIYRSYDILRLAFAHRV
jgi:hypothetical protein